MRLILEEKEYEIDDNCIDSLVTLLRIQGEKIGLPSMISHALEDVHSLSEEDLTLFASSLKKSALDFYNNLSTPMKLAAMAITRGMIAKLEGEKPELIPLIRPPKRVDPIEHLAGVLHSALTVYIIPQICMVNDAKIELRSTEDNTITSVEFAPNQRGGKMAAYGD